MWNTRKKSWPSKISQLNNVAWIGGSCSWKFKVSQASNERPKLSTKLLFSSSVADREDYTNISGSRFLHSTTLSVVTSQSRSSCPTPPHWVFRTHHSDVTLLPRLGARVDVRTGAAAQTRATGSGLHHLPEQRPRGRAQREHVQTVRRRWPARVWFQALHEHGERAAGLEGRGTALRRALHGERAGDPQGELLVCLHGRVQAINSSFLLERMMVLRARFLKDRLG